MGFFDNILSLFYKETIEEFRKFFNANRFAINAFAIASKYYTKRSYVLEPNLCKRLDSFASYFPKLNKKFSRQIKNKSTANVESRFNENDYSISQMKIILKHRDFIIEFFRIYNDEYRINIRLDKIKKDYPKALDAFCEKESISLNRLTYNQRIQILNHTTFAEEESELDFKKEVIDKDAYSYPSRRSCYKDFLKCKNRDENDKKFVMDHLTELDDYVKYYKKVLCDKVYRHYLPAFLDSKGLTDGFEYCRDWDHYMELVHFATEKLKGEYEDLKTTYPLGLCEFRKYFVFNGRSLYYNPFESVGDSLSFFSPFRRHDGNDILGYVPWEDMRAHLDWVERERNEEEKRIEKEKEEGKMCDCIINENVIQEWQQVQEEFQQITNNYYVGYILYSLNHPAPSKPEKVRNLEWSDIVMNYRKEVVAQKNLILKLNVRKEWIEKQKAFSDKCRNLRDSELNDYGCYHYDINYPSLEEFSQADNSTYIWQLFADGFCSSVLDYSLYPEPIIEYNRNNQFLSGSRIYKESVYDKILKFILTLKENEYKPIVLWGCDVQFHPKQSNKKHFEYLASILHKENILSAEYSGGAFQKVVPSDINYANIVLEDTAIVVVDFITDNDSLINYSQHLLSEFADKTPVIVYITLRKEYSEAEMTKLINDKRQAQIKEKEEVERKRIEEQQKREEEERLARELDRLRSCVSSWTHPNNPHLPCFSLYYYYPTTCGWEVNEEDWDIRRLVWNFKANPHRQQAENVTRGLHESAVAIVTPLFKRVLTTNFGNDVRKLTLCCIPASTQKVTEKRYKDFSEKLCSELGMTNGFVYVRVDKDGEAKHAGGGSSAEFSIDSDFFRDKYVILFDDIITSGRSMEKFKRMLEGVGAKVIAGLSIGKTAHHWHDRHPIDEL